ncbi:MAG: tetratricopeptide repeat protein [Acidobacteria bacterium]|nr:tetratricopeptide repeat protein [Acidobacteriota bacterium]MCI0620405.1 tetratricopeptide repeat protein [Acidobacteriota bacterium]MCI0722211.1 tetratricopeptide repeat protein [Acidobacteriota bacterium]
MKPSAFLKLHICAVLWLLQSSPLGGKPAQPPSKFELIGEVRLAQPQKPRRLVAYVALNGNTMPYSAHTWTDFGGKFKFKKLPAGSYSLHVEVRRRGEKRMTVEISPSLADRKGRIRQTITVEPAQSVAIKQKPDVVSVRELSIPEKARSNYLKAEKKLSKGEIEKGIALLEAAVNLAPHFVAAINRIGTVFHMQKQFSRAEQYFREALEVDPNAYAPLVNLGGNLLAMGRFQEALTLNQHAVTVRPLDALANAQLGVNYLSLKDDDKAMEYLIRTKELDPLHFTYPQLALAGIYHRQNKLKLMVQELREFLKLHPDDVQVKLIQKQIEALQNQN